MALATLSPSKEAASQKKGERQSYKIILIAGEASGDFLGASLMRALKKRSDHPITFYGLGGQQMQKEGLNLFFSYDKLNVLGITEVMASAWTILKRIKQTAHHIEALSPDLVVTIDLPGFNKRLAKKLKKRTYPLVHYVAPTVWAWRPGRAKKFAQLFDHLLALYPFEPPYFDPVGLPTTYVGHPMVFQEVEGDKTAFFQSKQASPDRTYIAMLPGSRLSEVKRLLPVFHEVVSLLAEKHPHLAVVLPTVPEVAPYVKELTSDWPVPVYLLEQFEERWDAYKACQLAIAASGTVSLELARAGLPMLITYRLSNLSAWIAKRLLKIKYVCLLNLILDEPVVPELLQEKCVPGLITQEALKLLDQKGIAKAQTSKTQGVLQQLKHTNLMESECAAQALLNLIER